MNNAEKTDTNADLRWKPEEKISLCTTPVFTVNRQYALSPEGIKKFYYD